MKTVYTFLKQLWWSVMVWTELVCRPSIFFMKAATEHYNSHDFITPFSFCTFFSHLKYHKQVRVIWKSMSSGIQYNLDVKVIIESQGDLEFNVIWMSRSSLKVKVILKSMSSGSQGHLEVKVIWKSRLRFNITGKVLLNLYIYPVDRIYQCTK